MNDDVVYSFARKLGIGGPPSHLLPDDHIPLPTNDHLCPWTLETKESTICMDRNPPKDPNISNTRHRMQLKPGDEYHCRSCDLSMGLGSASLTMEELLRAYSAFGTGGLLVEPYYIERVEDVDGNVLEKHEKPEFEQVMEPEVAYVANWLLQGVVRGGTASKASRLRVHLAGKTGTTNDEKDTWFVGMSPNIATAAWVGYDQPKTLGISSTGGRTALPIWMEYMRQAAPKEDDRPFPVWGDIEWAQIEEDTGRRVTSGGARYPFLEDTVPESTGISAGQITLDDIDEL
jgi:penicillin-binding protein 1A